MPPKPGLVCECYIVICNSKFVRSSSDQIVLWQKVKKTCRMPNRSFHRPMCPDMHQWPQNPRATPMPCIVPHTHNLWDPWNNREAIGDYGSPAAAHQGWSTSDWSGGIYGLKHQWPLSISNSIERFTSHPTLFSQGHYQQCRPCHNNNRS